MFGSKDESVGIGDAAWIFHGSNGILLADNGVVLAPRTFHFEVLFVELNGLNVIGKDVPLLHLNVLIKVFLVVDSQGIWSRPILAVILDIGIGSHIEGIEIRTHFKSSLKSPVFEVFSPFFFVELEDFIFEFVRLERLTERLDDVYIGVAHNCPF